MAASTKSSSTLQAIVDAAYKEKAEHKTNQLVLLSHNSKPQQDRYFSMSAASSYFLSAAAGEAGPQSRRKPGMRKRCLLMAKQEKTRFYILGRCIFMLLCWHDHSVAD